MKWTFENAKIKGRIVLTDSLHEDPDLLKDKTLYKFIWVDSGEVELDIDHQHVVLKKEQLVPLSHLHHLEFLRIEGKCYALMFNGNFYCIHGNDHEVSCNGLLFHGSSHVLTFVLSEDERRKIDTLTRIMQEEFLSTDHLQDEMLRVLLNGLSYYVRIFLHLFFLLKIGIDQDIEFADRLELEAVLPNSSLPIFRYSRT